MLSAWSAGNTENVNLGRAQKGLGGGSKSRKALGDAGLGSENASSAMGKSAVLSDAKGNKQRRPLGSRSENTPAPGKGAALTSATKPKQRRALGDISNAGDGLNSGGSVNGSKIVGKQPAPRLAFTIHSDARDEGPRTKGLSAPSSARPSNGVVVRESERVVSKPDVSVDEVEMPMGRMGDEEELLVQRRAEERAAKVNNPFKPASKRKTRTRETSFPVSSNSPMSTGRTAGLWPEVVRDAGPLTGGAAVGSDESFQIAIDRIVHDDMEELMGIKIDGKERDGTAHADDDLELPKMDWLTMAVEDLNSTPLSPLNDSFLSEDMEINFV